MRICASHSSRHLLHCIHLWIQFFVLNIEIKLEFLAMLLFAVLMLSLVMSTFGTPVVQDSNELTTTEDWESATSDTDMANEAYNPTSDRDMYIANANPISIPKTSAVNVKANLCSTDHRFPIYVSCGGPEIESPIRLGIFLSPGKDFQGYIVPMVLNCRFGRFSTSGCCVELTIRKGYASRIEQRGNFETAKTVAQFCCTFVNTVASIEILSLYRI